MMDFRRFPHLSRRARAVHAAMRSMAMFRPPTFRFVGEEELEHSIRLLRQRFRKPLMRQADKSAKLLLL